MTLHTKTIEDIHNQGEPFNPLPEPALPEDIIPFPENKEIEEKYNGQNRKKM